MNKELIKQYKAEFDYWLNGGKLLARRWVSDPNDGDCSYTIWYEIGQEGWDIDKVFNYSLEYDKVQIIIDDEYVEFRKALAEGKTVQYNPITQYNNRWDDIPSIDPNAHDTIKNYRIKLDGPKFKVGDWVRNIKTNKCFKLDDGNDNPSNLVVYNGYATSALDVELWQPQEGEWCWFLNNNKEAVLKQFLQMCLIVPTNYVSKQGTISGSVEPFIGTLPFNLKD